MGPGPMDRLAEWPSGRAGSPRPGAETIPAVLGAEALVSLGRHAAARELLAAHEPALRTWDPTAPGHEVLAVAGLCRLWLGDHEDRGDHADAADRGRPRGGRGQRALPAARRAGDQCKHLRRGDLVRAAECADEAAEIAETGLGGFGLTLALAAVAMVAAHRGDADTCRPRDGPDARARAPTSS